jgi:CheY-like chemotaxis protein
VVSSPGEGSTFYFTLPLFRNLEAPSALPGSKTILAIDDDPQVIGLYERYLQPHGYQVIPLTDSSHAIDRIKQVKPFAVTLDIMMPGIDGWQVLTDLKADRSTRDTPIILCSIVENQQKGFNLGATDYLVKPILEEELVRVLDRLNQDGSIREVMIIDDDENDLRLLGKMLTEDGRYLPILIDDSKKGWELITSGKLPQAIILDIFMPNMDGFEFLEKLKTEKKFMELPVVVLTSLELTADQRLRLQQFGHRLINKGTLDSSELVASIAKAIEHAPADK